MPPARAPPPILSSLAARENAVAHPSRSILWPARLPLPYSLSLSQSTALPPHTSRQPLYPSPIQFFSSSMALPSFCLFLFHFSLAEVEMQESVLSSRRAPPSPTARDEDDQSKMRKSSSFSSFPIIKHLTAHIPNIASSPTLLSISLLLFLLLIFASLFFKSRSLIYISPYASYYSRANPFGTLDGLSTDFGILGIPWWKLPSLSLIFIVFG